MLVRALDGTPGEESRPIVAATVEVFAADLTEALGHEAAPIALGTTDERGRALLQDLPEGVCTLRVVAAGFVELTRELDLQVPLGGGLRSELALLLRAQGAIRGRVLRPDGRPIAGALVGLDLGPEVSGRSRRLDRVHGGAGLRDSVPHTRTGPDGSFELPGVAGFDAPALRIGPGVVDLPPVLRHVLVPPLDGAHVIHVPDGAPVVLRARDATGRPCAGRLSVDSGEVVLDLEEDPVLGRLLTDRERVAIERLPGELRLRLAPGGYTVRLYPDTGLASADFLPIQDLSPVEHVIHPGEEAPPQPAPTEVIRLPGTIR